MAKREYCEIDLDEATRKVDEVALLNSAGANGWELVLIRRRSGS